MVLDLSPVGAAVARSLDMGKVTGSIPVLGKFENHPKGWFLICTVNGQTALPVSGIERRSDVFV